MASFTENFTGSENDLLTSLSGWSGTNKLEINSANQLRCNTNSGEDQAIYSTTTPDTADQQCTFTVHCTASNQKMPSAILRYVDTNNFYFAGYRGGWEIRKRVSGSFSVIGTADTSFNPSTADRTCIFRIVGDNLKLYSDGNLIHDITDTSISDAGSNWGINAYYDDTESGTARWIDTMTFEDYSAGATLPPFHHHYDKNLG